MFSIALHFCAVPTFTSTSLARNQLTPHRQLPAVRLRMALVQFPKEQSASGEFERQEDAFRHWISTDGSTPFPVVAGRYHLYVSLACPWASRTIIARKLLGLED